MSILEKLCSIGCFGGADPGSALGTAGLFLSELWNTKKRHCWITNYLETCIAKLCCLKESKAILEQINVVLVIRAL